MSPRDVTPDATEKVIERGLPGFGELMRRKCLEKTPTAIISNINGKLWWDIDVMVLAPDGKVLVSSNLKDTKIIQGSFWVGAKYAFEKAVPEFYLDIIRMILRDNDAVRAALRV